MPIFNRLVRPCTRVWR